MHFLVVCSNCSCDVQFEGCAGASALCTLFLVEENVNTVQLLTFSLSLLGVISCLCSTTRSSCTLSLLIGWFFTAHIMHAQHALAMWQCKTSCHICPLELHHDSFSMKVATIVRPSLRCACAYATPQVVERLSVPGIRRVIVVQPETRRVEGVFSLSDIAAYLFL